MKWFEFRLNQIVIVMILALIFTGTQARAADNLRFKIKLDKDTFLLREPVWVDLYFSNQGNKNVALDCVDLYWQELKVHLVNSKGDTLEYCGYVADGICRSGATLKPGETYHYQINLSENFGKGARHYLPPTLRYFEEDTYTLQMTHTGVSCNLIRFKVKSARGEEKPAYNLLEDATRSGFKYYDKEAQQVIDIFEELVSKYPKSAYADLASWELAGLYGLLGEHEKAHGNLRNLILDYPNSHFVLKGFPELLRQMTEDGKAEFLKEIIKKNPETRASDWANKSLECLETEKTPKK